MNGHHIIFLLGIVMYPYKVLIVMYPYKVLMYLLMYPYKVLMYLYKVMMW